MPKYFLLKSRRTESDGTRSTQERPGGSPKSRRLRGQNKLSTTVEQNALTLLFCSKELAAPIPALEIGLRLAQDGPSSLALSKFDGTFSEFARLVAENSENTETLSHAHRLCLEPLPLLGSRTQCSSCGRFPSRKKR
ncbi:hypothetical protein FOZ63_009453 [Perkinsus olseni]|uniref:Uncharacterized protein n=1 Tax=Perkinsus olseni TaxID=32597 RepID=A0A7J6T3B2_PEROL|nr:hypothetical protein FOZ60_002489 [Perkinsus olseni]KAF4739759.1 hypothetical protein FOZ63_009453 [Perkinsus olseni]